MPCFCSQIPIIEADLGVLSSMKVSAAALTSKNTTVNNSLKSLSASARAAASPGNVAQLADKIATLNKTATSTSSSITAKIAVEISALTNTLNTYRAQDKQYHFEIEQARLAELERQKQLERERQRAADAANKK